MEAIKDLGRGLLGDAGSAGFYKACATTFASFAFLSPALFLFDAPHGRAAPNSRLHRALCINGNVGWLIMEIVSPITFVLSLLSDPLRDHDRTAGWSSIPSPSYSVAVTRWEMLGIHRQLLAGAFVVHYINRSIVSTFRNSGRSPMHISIPIAAIIFNLLNGYLIGTWLGGRLQGLEFDRPTGFDPPSVGFAIGMCGWLVGFAGNIVHDEVLYALRRRSPSKPAGSNDKAARYSVPEGVMYSHPFGGISSPAYLCEWFEWACWAAACTLLVDRSDAAELFLAPPWLFVYNELTVMLPRAMRTHRWYKDTFRERYPKNRRAIIPGVL